jgi:aminopeptidase N
MRPSYRSGIVGAACAVTLGAAITACGASRPSESAEKHSALTANVSRDVVSTKLDVDLASRSGTAHIVFAEAAAQGATLDVSGLQVQAVTHAGEPVEFQRRPEGAKVWLDLDVPAGESFDVDVAYTYRRQSNFDGELSGGSTFTWPYFCGNLFPCDPNPVDGLTFELDVKNPPPGKTVVYPPAIPGDAPPYMAAWAVGNYGYKQLGTTPSGIEVGVYGFPQDLEAMARASAHLTDIVGWYETTIGPYSFGKKVAGVEVNWGPGAYGGMEHHPFWHVASNEVRSAEVEAHEAAHGWFGDGIRLRCWEDFVLSEGTVSYLAAVALEENHDPAGASIWNSYRSRLNGVASRVVWPASCGQVDVLRTLYNDGPYMKGAFFYRALEQRITRAAMLTSLSRVYEKSHGKAAGMQDVLDQVKADTGYDPTACAAAWLRASSIPSAAACH